MILSHFTGRIRDTQEELLQSGISVMWFGRRRACKVFAETGLDTYRSICLLSDQIPRLMVISLSFVVYVIRVHVYVFPFFWGGGKWCEF